MAPRRPVCVYLSAYRLYETVSNQKYICCFIRVTHAIKLCVLETEEFFELIIKKSVPGFAAINRRVTSSLFKMRLSVCKIPFLSLCLDFLFTLRLTCIYETGHNT
jgi:hypothetical protein